MSDDTDPIYTLLTSMYNAGTNKDSYNRDKLIQDSTLILPKECKRYSLNSESSIDFNRIDRRALTDDTSILFRYYQNNIEFVNTFTEQALEDERNYFVKKYSVKAYNALLKQREAYFKERQIKDNEKVRGECIAVPCVDTNTTITNTIQTSVITDLKRNMSMWLSGTDPKTTYRKIEYRSAEQETLSTLNQYVTFTYYVAFGVLIMLLATSGNLFLQERFLAYLFLLMLPVIYPFIFSWTYRTVSAWMTPDPTHGPKNAFLDSKPSTMDAYDM